MKTLQLKDTGSDIFVVPAGDEISLDFQGTFVQNLGADGELFMSLDRGAKMKFETGLGRVTNDGAEFTTIQLFNKGGSDVTVEMAWGYGDIKDSRLSVSGELQVINPTGEELKTHDADLLAALNSLLNKGRTNVDLSNATFAQVNNATMEVVSATVNVNGVKIHQCSIESRGTNDIRACVLIDGNPILGRDYNNGSGSAIGWHEKLENYLIPEGVAISIYSNTSASFANIWYEVL